MATPYAVRRGRSLLLRTLAVGGFAAAAWFVCTGVASAAEDHSDEVTKALDTVNSTLGATLGVPVDQLVTEAVPQQVGPSAVVTHEPQPIGSTQSFESLASFTAVDLFAVDLTGVAEPAPLAAMSTPAESDSYRYPSSAMYSDPETDSQSYSGYAGSSDYSSDSSGYSHSGTTSNTMPVPLYEAKVAAKTAAREAAGQAQQPASPSTVTVTAPAPEYLLPFAPITQASPAGSQVTPNTEVTWESPEPSAPAPAPKQAPAPSAPTASSGSADSGGGHRGGQIASLTGQSAPKPAAAWSTERPDDGRSPGSVPGLPSTSPD